MNQRSTTLSLNILAKAMGANLKSTTDSTIEAAGDLEGLLTNLEVTAEVAGEALKMLSAAEESSEANNGRESIPSEVRRKVWRRDGGKCVKCGSRERLEYDHIIPVTKGGSNTPRNIELLCEACNRAKSDLIR